MIANPHPAEASRLAALDSYDILDTPREADFDDIVEVVSAICDMPIALISLVGEGRQWFKAKTGIDAEGTPLDRSICAHAILEPGLFIVPDTSRDKRFADNPLVAGDPNLRFYAGASLETPDGLPLGTVCVLDYKPRTLDDKQKALLRLMASQVMKLLELRRLAVTERDARIKAEALAKENATLAREGDHRVMNSLQLVSSVLGLQSRSTGSREAKAQLEGARTRVHAIATVHRQLHLAGSLEDIDIDGFLHRLCASLKEIAPSFVREIKVTADHARLRSDRASTIGLLVAELVANCCKHAFTNDHAGSILVAFEMTPESWVLRVSDEGVGLPDGFDPASSTGVGMQVAVALVRRLDASLSFSSGPPLTTFTVTGKTAA